MAESFSASSKTKKFKEEAIAIHCNLHHALYFGTYMVRLELPDPLEILSAALHVLSACASKAFMYNFQTLQQLDPTILWPGAKIGQFHSSGGMQMICTVEEFICNPETVNLFIHVQLTLKHQHYISAICMAQMCQTWSTEKHVATFEA